MKKGLSILLVAAALFGFYGSAVNLNDVLACKDYWEEAGEKTTADMNKLEDGLNQLKENEQAYLDGKQQVADGEVALADAEKQLADGEAQLEAGRAELAKGEADYAAAPAKLADAKKQIAKGEKDLADGEKKLADGYKEYNAGKKTLEQGKKDVKDGEKKLAAAEKQLKQGENDLAAGKEQVAAGEKELATGQEALDGLTQLISGIQTILDGYEGGEGTWKPGYDALKEGRALLYNGTKDKKEKFKALAQFLPSGADAFADAVEDVAGDDEKQTADDYKKFIKSTNVIADSLPIIQKVVAEKYAAVNSLYAGMSAYEAQSQLNDITFSGACAQYKAQLDELALSLGDKEAVFKGMVQKLAGLYVTYATADGKMKAAYEAVKEYDANGDGQFSDEEKYAAAVAGKTAELTEYGKAANETQAAAGDIVGKVNTEKATILACIKGVLDQLEEANTSVNSDEEAVKKELQPGLEKFNASANDAAIDKLTAGQDQIAGGVSQIASAVLGNETLKAGVEEKLGKDAIKLLTAYKASTNPLSSSISDFAKFEAQMDTNPGLVENLKKAQALLRQTKAEGEKTLEEGKQKLAAGKKAVSDGETALKAGYAEFNKGKKDLAAGKKQIKEGEPQLAAAAKQLAKGEKDLAAGRKKLADGKAQYAQGLKDYAAAPGKLADGRRQLAEGEEELADGYKQYEEGKQTLADGKAKLAEYEDGEQQVRDGLATLTGTEADLNLESIADRLNGDVNFDNEDGHLDLDKGLNAVEVGRGYQADDGDLITEEIMGRAVGTAGLLGAGVLAVLAAILSFLKKNKGAGVFAILAAAAGAFGAFYGTQAGTYFSSIAGSTVGATGWVAAGILGAVALVHAITHFTAKKEA